MAAMSIQNTRSILKQITNKETDYHTHRLARQNFYRDLGCGTKSCDDRVCLCVCVSVREHISETARSIFTNILHVTYGCGSVIHWWCCDMLCASGYTEDVLSAHNDYK